MIKAIRKMIRKRRSNRVCQGMVLDMWCTSLAYQGLYYNSRRIDYARWDLKVVLACMDRINRYEKIFRQVSRYHDQLTK